MECIEEAKQFLADARKKSVAECGEEVAAVLKKYDCSLVFYEERINGVPKQGSSQIVIVPNG